MVAVEELDEHQNLLLEIRSAKKTMTDSINEKLCELQHELAVAKRMAAAFAQDFESECNLRIELRTLIVKLEKQVKEWKDGFFLSDLHVQLQQVLNEHKEVEETLNG